MRYSGTTTEAALPLLLSFAFSACAVEQPTNPATATFSPTFSSILGSPSQTGINNATGPDPGQDLDEFDDLIAILAGLNQTDFGTNGTEDAAVEFEAVELLDEIVDDLLEANMTDPLASNWANGTNSTGDGDPDWVVIARESPEAANQTNTAGIYRDGLVAETMRSFPSSPNPKKTAISTAWSLLNSSVGDLLILASQGSDPIETSSDSILPSLYNASGIVDGLLVPWLKQPKLEIFSDVAWELRGIAGYLGLKDPGRPNTTENDGDPTTTSSTKSTNDEGHITRRDPETNHDLNNKILNELEFISDVLKAFDASSEEPPMLHMDDAPNPYNQSLDAFLNSSNTKSIYDIPTGPFPSPAYLKDLNASTNLPRDVANDSSEADFLLLPPPTANYTDSTAPYASLPELGATDRYPSTVLPHVINELLQLLDRLQSLDQSTVANETTANLTDVTDVASNNSSTSVRSDVEAVLFDVIGQLNTAASVAAPYKLEDDAVNANMAEGLMGWGLELPPNSTTGTGGMEDELPPREGEDGMKASPLTPPPIRRRRSA